MMWIIVNMGCPTGKEPDCGLTFKTGNLNRYVKRIVV